jgi:hypothetical protein
MAEPTTTTTLDTTQEEQASPNGHTAVWQSFDDQGLLQHLLGLKPAEKLEDVPEWNVQILCRELDAESRVNVQVAAYDEGTKRTDFRRVFHLIVLAGCYNPATGNRVFGEKHRDALMHQIPGSPVDRLALTILRLSHLLADATEDAKKN